MMSITGPACQIVIRFGTSHWVESWSIHNLKWLWDGIEDSTHHFTNGICNDGGPCMAIAEKLLGDCCMEWNKQKKWVIPVESDDDVATLPSGPRRPKRPRSPMTVRVDDGDEDGALLTSTSAPKHQRVE